MTPRRLLILGIVAIAAFGTSLWLAERRGGAPADGQQALLYPKLKEQLNSVTAVRIFKPGDIQAVEIKRAESGWGVTERGGYAADDAKLRKLLLGLAEAKLYEEKTSNPDNYASLGVEDVKAPTAGGTRIEVAGTAEPVSLIVGKPGIGAQSSYVRRAGEPHSWLIDTNIDTSSTPDAWLRKEIIDVGADRIQSATIKIGDAGSYTAAKNARADANFAVEGLPKGKELDAPEAANGFATALLGLTLADVKPAREFATTVPAAVATFKTFDGLVVNLKGWTREDKHYISVDPSFDAAQAERFHVEATPVKPETNSQAGEGAGKETDQPAEAKAEPAPKANVAEEAKTAQARSSGWVYQIPQYKYEAIFKPKEELLKQ